MKAQERSGFLSAFLGNILARKKARKDAERNRKCLEEAAQASRDLKAQRIADEDIRKLTARLVYEAEGYIQAALESEGALYEPQALDALDTARAALNAWKKSENEAAAEKYLVGRANIVIPRESSPSVASMEQIASRLGIRERTLNILQESLRAFIIQNSIRLAGDPDAALAELSRQSLLSATGEKG